MPPERWRVVERSLLIGRDGETFENWLRQEEVDPALRDFRLLQYDVIFGGRHAGRRLFPEMSRLHGAV